MLIKIEYDTVKIYGHQIPYPAQDRVKGKHLRQRHNLLTGAVSTGGLPSC